jgi:hypothetical protein
MHRLGELFVPKTPDSRSWDPQNREFNLNPPCSFFFFLHVDYLLQRFGIRCVPVLDFSQKSNLLHRSFDTTISEYFRSL